MVFVVREQALEGYDRRVNHHASKLREIYKPVIQFIESVSEEVKYHKATLHFKIDGRWYIARGSRQDGQGYNKIILIDWITKETVFVIPAKRKGESV